MKLGIAFIFIVTVVVGLLADIFIGSRLNWPGCGAIFAIATMGTFIILLGQKKDDN